MEISLINIGNSRGIRIPKSWIKQLGLKDKIEVTNQDDKLVLSRPQKLRDGWAEAAKKMAKLPEDPALKEWRDFPNEFDKTEPPWKEQ